MKLITFPQMREDSNGNMVSENVFINPKYVVCVVQCEDKNKYDWCEILLHTQGTVLIGMCAEEVSRLLGYSGPTSLGFGPFREET